MSLPGQTVSTEILGLVTDATGAVIPSATIKVTRLAIGDLRTATTNETGNYVFPLLEIGEYQVTCVASGFKSELVRNVIVELQQKVRIDFHLPVGEQAETVEARAVNPLLLATRHVNAWSHFRYEPDRRQRPRRYSYSRADGADATEPRINTMSFTSSIEAIEEFKVQSAVYSAEFGVNSGAQLSVVIKSGTNNFHGTLFKFGRITSTITSNREIQFALKYIS